MAFTTLNLGLELTIPTNGTRNWGTNMFSTTWTKISQHQHTGSGDGAQMATGSLGANVVTTAKLSKNIGVTQAATLTPAGTTQTIDFDLGNVQFLDLDTATGDVTLTLSNPAQGHRYWIYVKQAATPRDIIWPASVLFPQGQKLLLTQTDNATDMVELYYDGTNFFADWQLDFS